MSIFAEQPVHCPSCGTLHQAHVSTSNGLASVAGIGLCCDADCREALRQASVRYIMNQPSPEGVNPFKAMVLSKENR